MIMTHQQAHHIGILMKSMCFNNVDPIESPNNPTALRHLSWMVSRIPYMPEDKAMRWLGYIQGVLIANGIATLDSIKEITRGVLEDAK